MKYTDGVIFLFTARKSRHAGWNLMKDWRNIPALLQRRRPSVLGSGSEKIK